VAIEEGQCGEIGLNTQLLALKMEKGGY
jgi:hypothetical protein